MVKRILYSILIFLTGFIILFFYWSPDFLAYHHPVSSTNVILEGWLPPFEIEQSVEHLYVPGQTTFIISGKKFTSSDEDILLNATTYFEQNKKPDTTYYKGLWLLTNSTLFFNVAPFLQNQQKADTLTFYFQLKGSTASGYGSHYSLYINGDQLTQGLLLEKEETVNFLWPLNKGVISSLALQFDNDLTTETEDRNLKVIGLFINAQNFPLNSSEVFYQQNENRKIYGFDSETDLVKNYLLSLGVLERDIVSLEFGHAENNQTLKSAKECAIWTIEEKIKSVNIVSSGIHSRRSWITYKRTLPKQVEVGVICFHSESSNQKHLYYSFAGIKSALEELLTYLWNWVQLN